MNKTFCYFIINLCFIFAYCNSFSNTVLKQNAESTKLINLSDTIIYHYVEEMPHFNGGEKELRRYIGNNIDFSGLGNLEPWGKAIVKFVVTKTGQVREIQIINAQRVPDVIEERIKKVFINMPKWIPGKHKGIPVSVWQTISIREPL